MPLPTGYSLPKFVSADNSSIDVVHDHPEHGEIVTTINELEYPDIWGDISAEAAAFDPPSAAELLDLERAEMQPYIRSFRAALKLIPLSGYFHMLDMVEQSIAAAGSVDPYDDIVIWHSSVTQVVRTHPDMDTFASSFGVSAMQLDAIFRVAQAIEAGAGVVDITALVVAVGAA